MKTVTKSAAAKVNPGRGSLERLVGRILHRIKNPFWRYRIAADHWRSVWIAWGWQPLGLHRIQCEGWHWWLSLGLVSVVHSHNLGQPNSVINKPGSD